MLFKKVQFWMLNSKTYSASKNQVFLMNLEVMQLYVWSFF